MQTQHQKTNPAAAPHNIVATHIDLSQFEGQFGGDADQAPLDLPPSMFDDPAFGAAAVAPQAAPETPAPAVAPTVAAVKSHANVKFKAIKIARAHSGTSELRLVEEMVGEGEKPHFYFEEVQQHPYQTTRMLIVSATKAVKIDALKNEDDVTVTLMQAKKYFASAVAKKYPDVSPRAGVTLSTYINVL